MGTLMKRKTCLRLLASDLQRGLGLRLTVCEDVMLAYKVRPACAQAYADEATDIPRPANWGGFLVRPSAIEFWHGRPSRLHDRLRFTAREGGGWDMQRLWP